MKTSQQLFNEIIKKLDGSRGAPLGRANIGGLAIAEGRIFDRKIDLDMGGYDKGGAYWGHGGQLRVAFSQCGQYVEYYRVNR